MYVILHVGIGVGFAVKNCRCRIGRFFVFLILCNGCLNGFGMPASFIGAGKGCCGTGMVVRPCPFRFAIGMGMSYCVGSRVCFSAGYYRCLINQLCAFGICGDGGVNRSVVFASFIGAGKKCLSALVIVRPFPCRFSAIGVVIGENIFYTVGTAGTGKSGCVFNACGDILVIEGILGNGNFTRIIKPEIQRSAACFVHTRKCSFTNRSEGRRVAGYFCDLRVFKGVFSDFGYVFIQSQNKL